MPDEVVKNKVMICGTEYTISKLKCKHLRDIDVILKDFKALRTSGRIPGLYDTLQKWMPFIIESIQVHNKEFGQEIIDEMTMDELVTVWNQLLSYSGITLTGETKPAAQIGDLSTAASVVPSAGPTETLTNTPLTN